MSIHALLGRISGDMTLKMESNINETAKKLIYGP